MKKALSVLAATSFAIFLAAGCSQSSAPEQSEAPNAEKAAEESSNEELPVYTPVFGCHLPESSVIVQGFQRLIDEMDEKTGGRFQATLSHSGQLGSERHILEACNLGSVDFCIGEANLLGNYVPAYNAFSLPFLFDTAEQYLACAEGEAGKKLNEALENATNLTTVASMSNGFRSVFLKKPVNSLADLQGVKIRTPESTIYVDTFTALGANPTPVNANEMYSAIQTGVVDGMENVNETIVSYKIYEVVSNCTITKHIHNDQLLMANKNFIESMAEEDRALLEEIALETAHWITEQSKVLDETYRKELEDYGIVYNEVDLAEFREAVSKIYDDYVAKDPMIQEIIDEVEAMRE